MDYKLRYGYDGHEVGPNPAQQPEQTSNQLDLELEALYDNCAGELTVYAVALVRRPDVAHDAVQEVFLRYFVERSYGRVIEHPRSWLYRVIRNYLLDWMETASVRREVSPEYAAHLPDRQKSPEERMGQAETAKQCASLLTSRELACIRLRAQGLSYAETAQVLGVRPGTVSGFLTRVNKKLKEVAIPDYRVGMEALCSMFLKGEPYSSGN